MAYNSTHDKYYGYIRKDAEYWHKFLQQNGTECILKIPRTEDNKRIRDIELAFGASTYGTTQMNYKEYRIHALIQPTDFNKVENGIETQIPITVAVKLNDGYVIEFRRRNKRFSFQVGEGPESFWDGMLYRGTLNLIKVEDSQDPEDKTLDDYLDENDILTHVADHERTGHSQEFDELSERIQSVLDSLSNYTTDLDVERYLVTKADKNHTHSEYLSSNIFEPISEGEINLLFE